MQKLHIYLIDGYGFVFRAFHSLPAMTSRQGMSISAVYGFMQMLLRISEDHHDKLIIVALDSGKPSFRKELYTQYKANRPEIPNELREQLPIIRDVVSALNIDILEKDDFEADDLIASITTLAKNQGHEVTILSSDKDLIQLMDTNVKIFDPMKQKELTTEDVVKKFGVSHQKIIDAFALIGDASDNIPGVPGIGPKTAADLLSKFETLEKIYQKIEEVSNARIKNLLISNKKNALLSKELVTLSHNAIDDFTFSKKEINFQKLANFLDLHGFYSLIKRFRLEEFLTQTDHHEEEKHDFIDVSSLSIIESLKESIYSSAKLFIDFDNESKIFTFSIEKQNYKISIQTEQTLFDDRQSFSERKIIDTFKEIFESNSIKKIMLGAKEFVKKLISCSFAPQEFEDIAIIAYTIDSSTHKYDREKMLKSYLGIDGKIDSFYVKRLYELLSAKLLQERKFSLYYNIEKPLLNLLAIIEVRGIYLDTLTLNLLKEEFSKELKESEKKIYNHAGQEFNIGSPKQVSDVLFTSLKLPTPKKSSKSDSYKTDADTLSDLSLLGYYIADEILEWRQLSKLISTYTDPLIKLVDKNSRLHTTFEMTATSTGRLSSREPNLQNIPIRTEHGSKIRKAFAAKEGCFLVSFDYSQIELRLLANIAMVSGMIEALELNEDIHAATASGIFNIPIKDVTSDYRRKAKAINFGIIYGISAFGLARNLKIPKETAKKYIDQYFEKYKEIKQYMSDTIDVARKNGYVETLFGRKCFVAGINDRNHNIRSFAERAAINAPLQGSAADIIKKAMVSIDKEFKDYMILQVHDELLFEMPEEKLDSAIVKIKNTMENINIGRVKLVVDVKIGKNWLGMSPF